MKGMIFAGMVAITSAALQSGAAVAQDANLKALEKCETAMTPGGLGGIAQSANPDLTSFCNAVRQLGARVAAMESQAESFSDAVVAFAVADPRNPDVDPCPLGWSLYERANGRVIVGVSSADRPFKTGGAREHTLTVEEMPSHRHTLPFVPEVSNLSGGGYPVVSDLPPNSRARRNAPTKYTGGNAAHNNMPPYVALYFCKKEG